MTTKKDIYFAGFRVVLTHHLDFEGNRLYDRRRFDRYEHWVAYATENGLDIEHGVWGEDNVFKDKTDKQVFYQAMISAFNFLCDPEYKKNVDNWCRINSNNGPAIVTELATLQAWKYDNGHASEGYLEGLALECADRLAHYKRMYPDIEAVWVSQSDYEEMTKNMTRDEKIKAEQDIHVVPDRLDDTEENKP